MQWLKRRLLEWLLDKRHKSAFDPPAWKNPHCPNDKIGDMIVSTPLRELKAAWPGVAIDVAASSVNRDIVRDCPHVDRTIVWDHGSLWHNLKADTRCAPL
jgi:hypothetical protein